MGKLLIFSALVPIGWLLPWRRPELARKSARILALMLAILLAPLAVAGWLHQAAPQAALLHRWGGHAFVILAWLSVPFSVGALLQRSVRRRPFSAALQALLLLAFLGLSILAGFTGYMGPTHVQPADQETQMRFTVLHLFALPGLIGAAAAAWLWLFRPSSKKPG
ncbi:MAG: hypothetical protein WD278_08630 [Pirellulales bacterium]